MGEWGVLVALMNLVGLFVGLRQGAGQRAGQQAGQGRAADATTRNPKPTGDARGDSPPRAGVAGGGVGVSFRCGAGERAVRRSAGAAGCGCWVWLVVAGCGRL